MTAHDPLCRLNLSDCDHGNTYVCHCTLIARVRADERERLYTAAKADSGAMFGIVLAAEPIEDEVRERLRAQVEALPERADAHDEDCPGRPGRRGICNCEGDILISRRAVLALLGGESE